MLSMFLLVYYVIAFRLWAWSQIRYLGPQNYYIRQVDSLGGYARGVNPKLSLNDHSVTCNTRERR
jgi:hypothetical protein